jgi:sodium/potassium-transporting ATPase subunit alpha
LLGDNKLTEKAKEPLWKKYVKEITSPFAIMLWVAAVFCFFTYIMTPADPSNLYLGFVLIIVILVTA